MHTVFGIFFGLICSLSACAPHSPAKAEESKPAVTASAKAVLESDPSPVQEKRTASRKGKKSTSRDIPLKSEDVETTTRPRNESATSKPVSPEPPKPALEFESAPVLPDLGAPAAPKSAPVAAEETLRVQNEASPPAPEPITDSAAASPATPTVSSAPVSTVAAPPISVPTATPAAPKDAPAAPKETPTPPPLAKVGLTGTMQADFATRRSEKPEPGAFDSYKFVIEPGSFKIRGTVKRYPRILSSVLGRETQASRLEYDVVFVQGGATRAEMKGTLPLDAEGRYLLSTKNADPLVLRATGAAGAATFAGIIQGKRIEQRGKLSAKIHEYARRIGGKEVKIRSKNIDPLGFQSVILPPAPLPAGNATTVSGNLDYDYDTGNWYTNAIQFVRPGVSDTITGSIKWIEDPRRDLNGKGHYEFNLRWNEAKALDEGAYFEQLADEELFFAVDPTVPTLSGNVEYEDTFGAPTDGENGPVVASRIRYQLTASGVTEEQLVQFVKLWLLIIGPVNDE